MFPKDEEFKAMKIKQIDIIIDMMFDMQDMIFDAYKWGQDEYNRLTPVRRQEFIKRIQKRQERGNPNEFFGT